jgi:hypothetical protein
MIISDYILIFALFSILLLVYLAYKWEKDAYSAKIASQFRLEMGKFRKEVKK